MSGSDRYLSIMADASPLRKVTLTGDPMTTVTIIDDEKRSLFYHTDSRVVHHMMKAPVSGGEFRDLLTRGAECMEQKGASKWLSDDRRNAPLGPEDSTWGETVWGPRVLKAGFQSWAIVVPTHAVGSLQMHRFANLYRKQGVLVEVFDDIERAWDWLKAASPKGRGADADRK